MLVMDPRKELRKASPFMRLVYSTFLIQALLYVALRVTQIIDERHNWWQMLSSVVLCYILADNGLTLLRGSRLARPLAVFFNLVYLALYIGYWSDGLFPKIALVISLLCWIPLFLPKTSQYIAERSKK